MNSHAEKTKESKAPSVLGNDEASLQFVDSRSEVVYQRVLQEAANHYSIKKNKLTHKKANNTGMIDSLKTGKESLSHASLDDVVDAKPLQRVIKTKTDRTTGEWVYYSDRDKDRTTYETRELALAAEAELKQPLGHPQYDARNRPPTMYSYAESHPTNEVSNLQGPHVVGYGAVDEALTNSKLELKVIFNEQVRSPTEVEEHINEAVTSSSKNVKSQIYRFLTDYTEVYNHVIDLILGEENDAEALDYIKWLVNTDPRSSTNWATRLRKGKSYKVPKNKLKYKNESRDISESKNVDMLSADSESGRALWAIRKKLTRNPEEEGSDHEDDSLGGGGGDDFDHENDQDKQGSDVVMSDR